MLHIGKRKNKMKEEKLIVYAPENFPKYKPNFIDKTR